MYFSDLLSPRHIKDIKVYYTTDLEDITPDHIIVVLDGKILDDDIEFVADKEYVLFYHANIIKE